MLRPECDALSKSVMARLILILLIAIATAITVAAVLSGLRALSGDGMRRAGGPQTEFSMPGAIQTIAFVLLVVLMFGVATGLIGGL